MIEDEAVLVSKLKGLILPSDFKVFQIYSTLIEVGNDKCTLTQFAKQSYDQFIDVSYPSKYLNFTLKSLHTIFKSSFTFQASLSLYPLDISLYEPISFCALHDISENL